MSRDDKSLVQKMMNEERMIDKKRYSVTQMERRTFT